MARENTRMTAAKNAQNDEFYTQYVDIQKEINAYLEFNPNIFRDKTILLPCDDPEWSNFTLFFSQNFETFGLRKLISTSYAVNSKKVRYRQLSLFEENSPQYDITKTDTNGKVFILEHDINKSGKIDIDDIQWSYLNEDGDFRSDEVIKLRDEADIIITNPPFSLFREFFTWIMEAGKQFLIIGNMNCTLYQEIFPYIKENKIWLGNGMGRWISGFIVPDDYPLYGTEARMENGKRIVATNNCLWLTNLDHGRRHQPLELMTMAENIKFSKHKKNKEWECAYKKYDNYDAIHIPFTDAIPKDYDGLMAVPLSFLDKYNPEQFEIVGEANHGSDNIYDLFKPTIDGKEKFKRVLIKKRG